MKILLVLRGTKKQKKWLDNNEKRAYNRQAKKQYSNAPLAQLVEQQTLNLMVGGSIPLWRTIFLSKWCTI